MVKFTSPPGFDDTGTTSSKDKSDIIVHCIEVSNTSKSPSPSSTPKSHVKTTSQHPSTTRLFPINSHIDPQEYAILAQQVEPSSLQSPVKFFTIFRYATCHDLIIIAIAYVSAIIAGAALPMTNFILGQITQDFSNLITKDLAPEDFQPSVNRYALYFVYIGLAVGGLSCVATYLLAERGEILAGRIRQQYFKAIIRQNAAYFKHIGHSEVTKRIIDDTHLIQEAISENSGIALASLASFISAIVVGFISSWKITCLMICALIGITLAACLCISNVRKWEARMQPAQSQATALISQIIRSIHTTAALGGSRKHSKRLDQHWNLIMKIAFRKTYVIALAIAFCWSIMYAAYALGFWQGSKEVENGIIDAGSLITAITAIVMGGFTLSHIWPTIHSIQKGIESGQRIFETIDRVSTVDATADDGLVVDDLLGKVEFKNVKLRFPSNPDQVVINDFSLTINAGETVAIVGPPGAGKSTLLGLVERYYDPVKGTIYIDDIDITKLNIQSLRRHIAYVAQEPFLFSGTIYENVAQGLDTTPFANQEPSVKLQMITKACREANAWGFILSLKEGLDTQVGERGCLLSIGQRQRIAIARAVVSQPRIFLLDEATSALTSRSEMFVQEALTGVSKSKTTIIITQRLPILRSVDRIIVMKDGMIAEQGTHIELMNCNNWYYKFVESQRDKNKIADKNPLLMYNKDRQASEISIRSARGRTRSEGGGKNAFDILDWNSSIEKNGSELASIDAVEDESLSSSSLIGMLLRVNQQAYKDLSIGGLAAVVCGIGYPLLSVCFSRCMEALMVPEERFDVMRSRVNKYSGYLVVLACVQFFAHLIMNSFMGRAGEKLECKIKHTIFRHLLRMDIEFYDTGESGSSEAVSLMLIQDASSLCAFGGTAVGQIITSIVTMLVGVFVAISADWRLGLVCAACVPVLIASGYLQFKVQTRFQNRTKKAYEASAIYAAEVVKCIKAVSSLTREKDILQRYFEEVECQVQQSRRHTIRTAAFYAIAQVVSPFCISLGFWYGSVLLLHQQVDMYQFYVSFMAIVTGSQAIQSIFSFAPEINAAKKCTSNIARLLDRIPDIDDCSREGVQITYNGGQATYGGGTLSTVEGKIELRDVSFRYPFEPEMTVLRGVSIKVGAGEFVAIVGPEASSERSSILELVEMFYRPTGGDIYMDNWKICELNLESYRQQLGYVHGKCCLIEGVSIMDNMLIGVYEKADGLGIIPATCQDSQSLVIKACQTALIHDFIMSLPNGYDTTSGILYSASQRIRLSIARAIVRNPRVLLIDASLLSLVPAVPPSGEHALSPGDRGVIQRSIANASRGRTSILVTGDVGLTEGCDRIYVMESGRIVESGGRAGLLARRGEYWRLSRALT